RARRGPALRPRRYRPRPCRPCRHRSPHCRCPRCRRLPGGRPMTTLVACSHGTRSPAGRTVIARIRAALAAAVPEALVREAYVDVEQPEVAGVVAEAAAHGPVVVVPLLLSTGFHTGVDIAAAVAP